MKTGPDKTSLRIVMIFNRYLERGGEESSVDDIYETLSHDCELRRCFFASEEWTRHQTPVWKQALWMYRNPASIRKLEAIDDRCQPDFWLLNNIFPVGSAAIYQLALARERPIVQYIHNFRPFSVNGYLWANDRLQPAGLRLNFLPEIAAGSWQQSRLKTAWYAGVLWWLHASGWLRAVRSWIAISQFMRNIFVRAGIPAEDIFVVPHSFERSPQPPAGEDRGYYLFLGRLTSAKGVRTLLDAWKLLGKQLGSTCPRLVVGGEGPLREEVARLCEAQTACEYVGYVSGERKDDLLRGCRGMIVPSIWWEPLGLVTYECYNHGKPVFAARSGALTETVVEGQTGYLHEPGNAEDLARQVAEADAAPQLRREMGLAGYQWLGEKTSKELWRERIQRAFKHAM